MIKRETKPKILLWDIETTNLNSDFGTVLCCGYKWLGEKKVTVPSIMDYPQWKRDPTNDGRLMKDLWKALSEADIWVTYYGERFDVPYLNSKLLEHGLPPFDMTLGGIRHIDLWKVARKKMKLSSNRLANLERFLNVKHTKTPVLGRDWKKAMCGDERAIRYVIDHCKADVLVLEEVYERLRPLVTAHPRVNLTSRCVCGSNNVRAQGRRILRTKVVQRFQCRECGAWGHE